MLLSNKKEKVTIIIPVYNVSEYLDRCMESVMNQTYTNLEIILVNDGSTDDSGTKCDKYQKSDSRIRVIHQKNAGLSAARNAALDIMTGEYIMFIDSDDKVDVQIVEFLLEDIYEYNCDIVESNFYDIYQDKIIARKSFANTKVYTPQEAIKIDIGTIGGSVSACGKLYKKEIFSTVRYREGKISEDGYAIVDVISQAKRIVIDIRHLYYYYHRKNSITTNIFTEANLDEINAYKYNLKQVKKKYPHDKSLMKAVLFRLNWTYLAVIDRILLCESWGKNTYLHKLSNCVKKNKFQILTDIRMRPKRKLAFIIFLVNKSWYRKFLIKNYEKKYEK